MLPNEHQQNQPLQPNVATTDTGAGINPYWNYESQDIPGIGTALVNVGTGNLIIQSTDLDIPERGVDLAFTRTYNSQSLHDINGDDGSEQAIFGNQWTNTYDAHLVFQANGQISVYDADGTRCDYSPNGSGGWTPCTGQYAVLEADPQPNSCSYWWIKKDGTALWFYSPVPGGNCFISPGKVGRLYEIVGRNSNNVVTLSYSFQSGEPQTAQYITQIVANHSDGQSITMTFAQVSGYNELAQILYPTPGGSGQAEIRYSYDISGDLIEVDKPGNDASGQVPGGHGVPSGDLPQTYGLNQPTQYACGPRATIALWNNVSAPVDGACVHFDYDPSLRLTDWQVNGVLNPQIGSQGYLQPSQPNGWNQYYIGYFVYGSPHNPPCSGTASTTTTMCDSNGHSAIWTIDSAFRVSQTQVATGKSSPSSLVTTQTWDTNNNLVASTDPRSDESDYAYDTNGNLTALALPSPGVSDVQNKGNQYRATTLFSYDPATNNLLAVCDPSYTDALGLDWTGNPGTSDSLCPLTQGSQNSQGATLFKYNTSSVEPYGWLTDTYTPMGYHTTYSYNHTGEGGGDYGLPTSIQGQTITQNDNSQINEQQNLTYDLYGNVATAGNGIGTWTINYDNVNRPTSIADPTQATSYTCYNEDDSVSFTTTPLQYQMDGASCGSSSVSYSHDPDGDIVSVTHHYNSSPGSPESESTSKFYDGLDRLVAVTLPAGINIDGGAAGKTRYIYDLTQTGGSGNLSVGGSGGASGITAYGNLYKTQRCITTSCNWTTAGSVDVNGNAYDALNRATNRYQYTPTTAASGTTPGATPGPLETWKYTYDELTQNGVLTTIKDPVGTHTTLTYDGVNRLYSKSFDDGITPAVSAVFDLDSRIAVLSSSVGSENYSYDYDGRLATYSEGGSIKDPETLTYTYYANGWRQKLHISDPGASYTDSYTYDYREDGVRKDLNFDSQSFTWSYDNAGRVTSQTDPAYGSTMPTPSPPAQSPYSPSITIGAKTMSYWGDGMLKSLTMPNGAQYSNMTYDAEGDILNVGINFPNYTGNGPSSTYVSGVSYGYDERGELNLTKATAPAQNGQYQTILQMQVYNGHPGCSGGQNCTSAQPGVDKNTGGVVNMFPSTSQPPPPDDSGCQEPQWISYDADGRQVSDIVSQTGDGGSCQGQGPKVADQRTYDAENHLVQDQCGGLFGGSPLTVCAGNTNYVWGPTGHLSKMGSNTLHWDGSNLLFVTSSSNSVAQLDVEHLAWRNSQNGALVVVDRDYSGAGADKHTKTTDYGLNAVQDWFSIFGTRWGVPTINGQYPQSGSVYSGDPLFDIRPVDGYDVWNGLVPTAIALQGVRIYDHNTTQWSTPDDYHGQVDDPMSQMPYLWNGNNPLTNSDPSGYDSGPSGPTPSDCKQNPNQAGCPTQTGPATPPPTIADVPSGCSWQCLFGRNTAAALAITRGTTFYFATETSTGKPYVGITFDNRFGKRSLEQLARGRQIQRAISGLSRRAARGLEQYFIKSLGLGNLENEINSIAESNPEGPGMIQQGLDESEQSGLLPWVMQQLSSLVESTGGVLP